MPLNNPNTVVPFFTVLGSATIDSNLTVLNNATVAANLWAATMPSNIILTGNDTHTGTLLHTGASTFTAVVDFTSTPFATTWGAFNDVQPTAMATSGYADQYQAGHVGVTQLVDDFYAGISQSGVGLIGGVVGMQNFWQPSITNTIGAQITSLSSTFANPGQWGVICATLTSSQILFFSTEGGAIGLYGSNVPWQMDWIVQIPQAAGTANVAILFGLYSGNNGLTGGNVYSPGAGIYVRYNTGTNPNGIVDPLWTYVCASGTPGANVTISTVNSTAVNSNGLSYNHFRIRSTTVGTIGFSVNGGSETAIASNVATVTLSPVWGVGNLTAVSKSVNIDYFSLRASTGRT
jgi:hypothetical protein